MMIYDILFHYLTVSVTTGFLILLLCVISPYINKKYTAKTKYYIWLIIALFLIIPIEIPLWKKPMEIAVSDTVTIYDNTVSEGSKIIWSGNQKKEVAAVNYEENIGSKAIRMPEILILIWSIGILICLCYEMLKYQLYKKYIYRWSKLPKNVTVTAKVDGISKEIGVKQEIPILICEKIGSPMMIGFLHPCIFLPHEDFAAQDLSIIIGHELTHYKRKDLWYKILLVTARVIHWFNPFVYMMCRHANADIEQSCDDYLLAGKPYEYRKTYSEIILATIKHQKINILSTYFHGGGYITMERFKNILNVKSKKRGRGIWLFVCICIVGANSLVSCRMSEEISNDGKKTVVQDEDSKRIRNEDSDQTQDEDSDQIEKQDDDERVVIFAQDFIDKFNGTIAGLEEITLSEYIGNSNLLVFAEKMIILTQRQEELEMNAVIYGAENEFNDVKYEEIDKDIFYVKIQFSYEGSGMSCQLIIKKTEEDLEIMDFYFGTQDGVDTISTGHHAERKVDNPNIWNEEDWVTSVFERLIEYEGKLQ